MEEQEVKNIHKYSLGNKNISAKDYNEAQDALKALKMKMNNAPKPKPVAQRAPQQQRFVPTFDIEEQMSGNRGGNMGGMNAGGYGNKYGGNNNNYNDYNDGYQDYNDYGYSQPMQSKPVAAKKPVPKKTGVSSKPAPSANKRAAPARKPLGPPFGGKGGFSGGGMEDNRPLGGGSSPMDYNEGEGEETFPCPDCGRKFRADVLQKHVKICKKVFSKKRKAFNMQKHRMVDGEQASLMKYGQKAAKNAPKPKKNNWKAQSEEFRAVLRANRGLKMPGADAWGGGMGMGGMGGMGGMSGMGGGGLERYRGARGNYGPSSYGGGMKSGGMKAGGMKSGGYQPGPAPVRSVISDSFTLCKFCNRRYNDEAYHKHLPGCERRYKEAQIKNKLSKPAAKKGVRK